MKLGLIAAILITSNCVAYSQTSAWQRADRDNIYNDCLSYLSTNYKHLSDDKKETLSLCFLDQVTEKYSHEEYLNKIEVELKRLKSATISECAKTHGIDLNAPIQQNIPNKPKDDGPTRENIVGLWKEKNEDREFELSSMGTFTMIHEGKRSTGKWQLDGMKLTLYFDRLFGTKERVYDIQIWKEDNFGYTSAKGSFYNVVRVKK